MDASRSSTPTWTCRRFMRISFVLEGGGFGAAGRVRGAGRPAAAIFHEIAEQRVHRGIVGPSRSASGCGAPAGSGRRGSDGRDGRRARNWGRRAPSAIAPAAMPSPPAWTSRRNSASRCSCASAPRAPIAAEASTMFLHFDYSRNIKPAGACQPICCGPGGEGGIRTHGGREPTAVFKTAALNHSATSPCART